MLKVDFTNETIFGFEGPNLCLLGNEDDFENLSKSIVSLTIAQSTNSIELTSFDFVDVVGENVKIIFSSRPQSYSFGKFTEEGHILFELDDRYWERIFVFFALMSWDKKTYYLNSFEDALKDLPLEQDIHLLCSSEF